MAKFEAYSQYTIDAVTLLARQIQLRRKQRKWSELELAQRAGVSRSTLQKIEKANMRVAIGIVFEVAALVGVTLFEPEPQLLREQISSADEKLALLPKNIRKPRREIDDDF